MGENTAGLSQKALRMKIDNLATEALTPAEIESAWAAAAAEATEEASASTAEEALTTNVNQQPINHNNQ